MLEQLLKIDQELLIYLNNLGSVMYDPFWLFITEIKHSFPIFGLIFICLFIKMDKKKALQIIVATLLLLAIILLLTEAAKVTFQRMRPMDDPILEGVIRELIVAKNYSFFSGHSATSFGLATFLILVLRKQTKWIYGLAVWAIFFSYSRIYVGAHYPLDILMGALIGILLSLGFKKIINKFIG